MTITSRQVFASPGQTVALTVTNLPGPRRVYIRNGSPATLNGITLGGAGLTPTMATQGPHPTGGLTLASGATFPADGSALKLADGEELYVAHGGSNGNARIEVLLIVDDPEVQAIA